MFLIDVELIFFFFDVDSIEEDRMVYQNESPENRKNKSIRNVFHYRQLKMGDMEPNVK